MCVMRGVKARSKKNSANKYRIGICLKILITVIIKCRRKQTFPTVYLSMFVRFVDDLRVPNVKKYMYV